jgi:hypothetical protein
LRDFPELFDGVEVVEVEYDPVVVELDPNK